VDPPSLPFSKENGEKNKGRAGFNQPAFFLRISFSVLGGRLLHLYT